MNLRALTKHKLFKPVLGAALTVLCGLALWSGPIGERWVNASYDYLFCFGSRSVTNTNRVALILMDNTACYVLGQVRTNWDRAKHAELLKTLKDSGCPLVVFDVFFGSERQPATDADLAEAMRRHGRVVLMAQITDPQHPIADPVQVLLPHKLFLDAATNWGIARTEANVGGTARRHWPFPSANERDFPSLPWTAARKAGARLNENPQERWLRYYGEDDAWQRFSYHEALTNAPGAFRNRIVFIGSDPQNSDPNFLEEDKFRTPFTRWNKVAVGGVKIMATTFLNLVNGDWLRRSPNWLEAMVLVVTGVLLGGGLSQPRPLAACGLAVGSGLVVTIAAAALSHFSNFWFPWLVIAGGQVPAAFAFSLAASQLRRRPQPVTETLVLDALAQASQPQLLPDAPDYELFNPPFGQGAYGKVWLARNAIGQWQALKAVYLARFGPHHDPYEREFNGIRKYKPISNQHPGLLRVDFVSTKKAAGYFYYVMELGDALEPGWEHAPSAYRPRDLAAVRACAHDHRLPVQECIRVGLALAEALDFLHRQGLIHRDIKPQNIIFVNGQPKLADVGLVAEILPPGQERTWVGTPGYMPPPPEPPGTQQADIYGLGMVLYVIRTGRDPDFFPAVSTTLVERTERTDFIRLNALILKACQPDRALRYASAAQLHADLLEVQKALLHDAAANRENAGQQ